MGSDPKYRGKVKYLWGGVGFRRTDLKPHSHPYIQCSLPPKVSDFCRPHIIILRLKKNIYIYLILTATQSKLLFISTVPAINLLKQMFCVMSQKKTRNFLPSGLGGRCSGCAIFKRFFKSHLRHYINLTLYKTISIYSTLYGSFHV